MVCRVIWADRVALRGVEVAVGYKELDIVTMEKTCKESTNRRQPSKLSPI